MNVRAENPIREELRRCERLLARAADNGWDDEREEMYGAVQALSWVLRMDAAAPSALASRVDA